MLAPKTTDEATAFLRREHASGRSWLGHCLVLQRTARGIPPMFPTALSAAHGTPPDERVYKISNLKRGMVAYSDSPVDDNPFGHIYYIAGWKRDSDHTNPDNCFTWSNDVVSGHAGAVGLVRLSFYLQNWNVPFQFGATWLNGYDFAEFNAKPKPPANLGATYDTAIKSVEKAISFHKSHQHPRIVDALLDDLERMKRKARKFS